MDPVVMVALEVGASKERLVGKYSSGKLSVELEKPVTFGKVSDILKEYNVQVDTWPAFLQQALTLEAWLWVLEYRATAVGTSNATTIHAPTFTLAEGKTFPSELEGAEIEEKTSGESKTYEVKRDGKTLQYTVTKTNDHYALEASVYKFIIQGEYANALPIIKGILSFKSLTFGVTNDPTIDTADFEKACRKVLESQHPAKELTAARAT